MTIFLEILGFVLAFVATCLGYAVSVKREVEKRASDSINFAEEMSEQDGTIGEEKLEDAVAYIRETLPAFAKPFVTDNMIRIIVQKAFDKIEFYAQKQVEKAITEEVTEETTEE